MTDTPEQPEVGQAVEVRHSADLDRVARLGMWLAASEAKSDDPKAKGMAAALRIETARQMGLPPWAAGDFHFIDGRFALSSRMKRAMAPKHGLRVIKVDEGDDFCTAAVVVIDTGEELGRTTFTLEMARKMGLLDKRGQNWQRIPDRMLWARASGRAIDDYAPWVSLGFEASLFSSLDRQELEAEGDEPDEFADVPFGDVELEA